MSCNLVQKRLVALSDGELSPSEQSFVLEHLQHCETCLEQSLLLDAATPHAPYIQLPPHTRHAMHIAVEDALDRAWTEPVPARAGVVSALASRRVSIPAPALLVVAATVLFVLGWGVASWTHSPSQIVQNDTPAQDTAVTLDAYRPAAYTPEDGWF